MDEDRNAPIKNMLQDYAKINFNIFIQNYDPQTDGYKQINNWKDSITWVPLSKTYSHFYIDVPSIKKSNNILGCMGDYIPQPDPYPPGVRQGKPLTFVDRKWQEPV